MRRRAFVKTMPALAVASSAVARQPDASARIDSSFDPWVELHRANLRHNVSQISELCGGRPILAVVKNNGYGMGVSNVARLLETESAVHGFAVVKLAEAVSLREAGIKKPVLLMGPFDEAGLDEAVARDIMPMVYTPIGDMLDRVAAKRQRAIDVHVCVDTGIGRVGVPFRRASPLIEDLAGRDSVTLAGVMMTFAEDADFDVEQKRRFKELTSELSKNNVPVGRLHAASSFGLFQHEDFFLDMVRPGMAIYGVYSEQKFRSSATLALRPALALKARVAFVKRLEAEDSAGYERAYWPKKPMWVATLPVGHTDGVPRTAASGGKVRIGDELYPIVASISASHTIVELGPETDVAIGDEVTMFDDRDGSRPEDLSRDCGASVYDLTMHLNPLLPRRVV